MRKFHFCLLFIFAAAVSFCQNPQLLKDVYPGATGSGIQQIVKTTNYTFFNAEDDDADADRGLYRTDGTPGGTIKLNLTYPTYISTKAEKLTALGNKIVFAGDNFGGYYGEIWASDGTQAGTIALERFQPTGSNRGPVFDMAKVGSNVLYSVIDNSNHALLKKTDGTPAGTSVVYDFTSFNLPEVVIFKEMNGVLYFDVYDRNGTGADQLWRSDGTTAGTYMLYNFGLSQFIASNLMVAGNNLYVMIVTPGTGNVLWKSDGTVAGTVPVKTIYTSGNNNYPPNVAIGSTLYFAGLDANGKELWKTDGTAAGTVMVADINSGAANSNPNFLTLLNGNIYFSANGGAHGAELWKFDGSTATEVRDLWPGIFSSNPFGIVESNGTLLFTASNDGSGAELFISDGTAANTKLVADMNPSGGSSPGLLTGGNPVYFSANNGVNGAEPYKYDNSTPIAEIHSKIYVNDNNTANDVYTTAVGNNANTGTRAAPVATLTQALVLAQTGDTIVVDAGVYAERVLVNKSVYFKGAYSGSNPGSSLNRGVSETIMLPSAENNLLEIVTVQSPNVTFDGFLFDGDNPSITGSITLNGVDVNAGMGIFNGNLQTDNLVVKNNILKNFFRYGVFVQKTTTPVLNGVNVTRNHIDNVPSRTPRDGRAVSFFNRAYGAVTNNLMTRVNTGVLVANMDMGSTDSLLIESNVIEAYTVGVSINSSNNLTSSIRINNNQISVANLSTWTAPGSTTVNTVNGISVTGVTTTKIISLNNNTITGTKNGMNLFSVGTPEGLLINGGTISNSPGVGIFYIGVDPVTPKLTLNNVTLLNNDVGIDVSATDNSVMPVEFSGTSITGGSIGLRVYGVKVALPGNTLTGISFAGQSNSYIMLTYYAFNGLTIDATSVSFDGLTGANMTLAQRFAAENKIIHRVDYNGGGFIRIKAGEVYVTPSSFIGTLPASWGMPTTSPDINRAANSATENDSVFIAAGTYANQVTLDKGISLIGEASTTTSVILPATPAVSPPGTFTEKAVIQTVQFIGDIHIRNLSVTGDPTGITPIILQGGGSVKNCSLQNGNQGVYFRVESGTKTVVIENNLISAEYIGVNTQGPGMTVSLLNNTITVANPGFSAGLFAGLDFGPLPRLTVTGNIISNFTTYGLYANSYNSNYSQNSITGPSGNFIQQFSGNPSTATCNWFGSIDPAAIAARMSGAINYSPWLTSGTDTNPAVGFQPAPGTCTGRQNKFYVNDNSQSGDVFTTAIGSNSNNGLPSSPFLTPDYAYGIAQAGDTIYVDAGTYNLGGLTYSFSKAITLLGANYLVSPNDPSNKLLPNSARHAESILTNGKMSIASSDIRIEGFTWEVGNRIGIELVNTAGTNNDFGNFQFKKNTYRITHTTAGVFSISITGKFVSTPNMPQTSGYTITDNRFEKSGAAVGVTLNFQYIKNIIAADNTFLVTGTTVKTQQVFNLGSAGLVDAVLISDNTIDEPSTAIGGNRIAGAVITGNKMHNVNNAFSNTNTMPESSSIEFSNNEMGNDIGTPFMLYNRTGTGVSNVLKVENNTITGVSQAGVIQLFGSMNFTFANSALNPSFIIRGNKITYSGDFSSVSSQFFRPVTVRGNIASVTLENNELIVNNSGGLGAVDPAIFLPANPAFSIITDNGASYMPSNAVINVLNNKIQGYRQSVVFYDNSNTGHDTYAGYGNIPAGVIVNIHNNSFTNDSISINNGAVSEMVNATCNWYGSAAAQNVSTKISTPATVNYSPWLTNGTDNDPATGFQPVAGNCNGVAVTAVLTQVTNVTCNGANNGAVNVTISGGTAPYIFAWSKDNTPGYSSAEDLSGLAPGVYQLTVTDANGSVASVTAPVTEPSALTASATGTNVNCFGGSNGSATVTPNGGTLPYTYLWSNNATAASINGLLAGTYSVTVTDGNGCTTTASYTVTQPNQLTAIATGSSTSCMNSITVVVNGGTVPYSYLWSNGATTASISSIPAGTYSVTITDQKGCTTTAGATVTASEAFNPSASVTNVSCNNGSNGSITITNVNATPPFSYSIDGINFQPGNTFSGLTAGSYTLTVRDANGCTGFVTKTVTQPAVISITVNSVQPTCYGQNNGAISITATGGSGSFTYNWTSSNGFTSSQRNISNLADGVYTLTVTDNNGCTRSITQQVVSSSQVFVTEVVTTVRCKGEASGSINLTVSGGSGSAFNFTWNTGAVSEDLFNLIAGNYSVTITDPGTGCTVTKSYVMTQPASSVNLSVVKTNATGCASLGTISITGSGGTAPYQYSKNGVTYQSQNIFTDLYAGNYTVWVKDANGCTKSAATSITDNGSDEYESNNSKNQGKLITIGAVINARIATAADVADWFKFTTPTGTGNYVLTFTHPAPGFVFNMYVAGNNTPPLVPLNLTSTSKEYVLAGNTTYYISITTSGFSYTCYTMSVSQPFFTRTGEGNNTGKEEVKKTEEIVPGTLNTMVYPNPHHGSFTLVIDSPVEGMARVELFSITGQKMGEKMVPVQTGKNNVPFSGQRQGTLLYRVQIGKFLENGKVIGIE
ncbi:MAG: hypothetical protein ABIT05_08675 [Chitinophagaceae bacterium]